METLIKFYINDVGYIASAIMSGPIEKEFVVPTMILRGHLEGKWDWYYNWYYYGLKEELLRFYHIYLWDNGTIREVDIKIDSFGV